MWPFGCLSHYLLNRHLFSESAVFRTQHDKTMQGAEKENESIR